MLGEDESAASGAQTPGLAVPSVALLAAGSVFLAVASEARKGFCCKGGLTVRGEPQKTPRVLWLHKSGLQGNQGWAVWKI